MIIKFKCSYFVQNYLLI